MISKSLALEVLNKALETGADYAEIFYEDSHSFGVILENNKVHSSASNSTNGVGLRLLKENQCIYGYTSDLSKKGLLNLAESLSKSFKGSRLLTVKKFDLIKCKNRNPIRNSYDNVTKDEMVTLIREGTNAIEELKDPRLVRVRGSFSFNHRFVAIYNSKEKCFKRDSRKWKWRS